MAFVGREDLEQLQRDSRDLAVAQDEIVRLRNGLEIAQAAGSVAMRVSAQIAELQNNGVLLETAAGMAELDATTAERERFARQEADRIRAERGAEFAATFRTEHGSEVTAALTAQFETDGTFAGIRHNAETTVRSELRGQVISEHEAAIVAELEDPSAVAAIKDEIDADFTASPEIRQIRKKKEAELRGEWRKEVEDAAIARVDEEERAKEDAFKQSIRQEIADSYPVRQRRDTVRQQLQTKWRDQTTTAIMGSIEPDELAAVLTVKAKKEAEDQAKTEVQAARAKYKAQFEGAGIATDAIPADTKLMIYLGEIGDVQVRKRDEYDGRGTSKTVTGVICQRTLKLYALDNTGRFRVDYDSLSESSSAYEANDAIGKGTVIVIGHMLKENGKPHFERLVSSESEFYYDDDTTNDNVVAGHLPVSEIEINGVAIRDLPIEKRSK